MSTHHSVTIDYGKDGYPATLSLTCSAPADAPCRAEWTCDCEEFSWSGNGTDGLPVHTTWSEESDDEVEHVGTFGTGCNIADWFADSDDVMRGKVTVPVTPRWDGDCFEFLLDTITEATS
jgi:hypothetical protein